MMPAFVEAALRALLLAGTLLILIAVLTLVPARHVLAPLWPAQVFELHYRDGDGSARHRFQTRAELRGNGGQPVIARDRPISLVCLERRDFVVDCGFLLGTRSEPDRTMAPDIPQWLQPALVESLPDSPGLLVMELEQGEVAEVPVEQVVRLYRPNQLDVSQRTVLGWLRLVDALEQWWPYEFNRFPAGPRAGQTR